MKKCRFCDAEISDDAIKCPACGRIQDEQDENPFTTQGKGFFERVFDSVRPLFSSPSTFFETLNPNLDITHGLMFYLVIIGIAVIADTFWNLLVGNHVRNLMMTMNPEIHNEQFNSMYMMGQVGTFFGMIFRFVFSAIQPFIMAGIYHIVLLVLGEGKNGYKATLNAVFFASTPLLLYIIPFCGSFFAFFWVIALQVIGISRLQQTTTGRALTAVLAIYILILMLLVLLISGIVLLGVN